MVYGWNDFMITIPVTDWPIKIKHQGILVWKLNFAKILTKITIQNIYFCKNDRGCVNNIFGENLERQNCAWYSRFYSCKNWNTFSQKLSWRNEHGHFVSSRIMTRHTFQNVKTCQTSVGKKFDDLIEITLCNFPYFIITS